MWIVELINGTVCVAEYLFCNLVQSLGLLGKHVLGLVPLVPVPGPGALCVHVHCDHCHLMRTVTRRTGGHQAPIMALAAVKSYRLYHITISLSY